MTQVLTLVLINFLCWTTLEQWLLLESSSKTLNLTDLDKQRGEDTVVCMLIPRVVKTLGKPSVHAIFPLPTRGQC